MKDVEYRGWLSVNHGETWGRYDLGGRLGAAIKDMKEIGDGYWTGENRVFISIEVAGENGVYAAIRTKRGWRKFTESKEDRL